MSRMSIEEWYDECYGDGQKIRIQELYSCELQNILHARDLAMGKIRLQLDWIKENRRPNAEFKVSDNNWEPASCAIAGARQMVNGWIDAREI